MTTEPAPQLRVLSLGWGVQSWTIAAMIALGELPPVDYAVHADTQWERQGTYQFAAQMTEWLKERGVQVVTVSGTRTEVVRQPNTVGVMIPAFTVNQDGSHGQVRRQCTGEWKIRPLRRFAAAWLAENGFKKTPGVVEAVLGISWDEATRSRSSEVAYIENTYPLVDARITRQDCIAWLEAKQLPIPLKSACVFCPYHNKATWERMARTGGEDWEKTLEVDEAIRDKRPKGQLFVHPARVPLADAVSPLAADQTEMWPEANCDGGYCFV